MQTIFTDISVSGCYLLMRVPFPIGTHLDVEMWIDQDRINTPAIVRTCDLGAGMGG